MASEIHALSDEALACQSQGGDLAAFEELVRRYENRIYSFLFRFGGHDADAREATQDTFVRAYTAIGQYNSRHPFAAWLFTIARRKGIDCFRARIPGAGQEPPEEGGTENPADVAAQRDEAEVLWRRARAALPNGQFQALWLRYVEDMDIAQIAVALGKTRTHIKVLLFRARQTLAEILPEPETPPVAVTKGASR